MNKLLKNKKNQKGAVSTVVLFTIIMFIIILTGVYTTVTLNAKVQLQSDSRIQELYGKDVDNIDDIYIVQEAILKDGYNSKKYVNSPKILSGMHPIKYDMPTEDRKGGVIATTINDNEWYEYGSTYETRKWANTQTEDGSMWVWIPRYAYRINEEEGTVDVKFLVGTTDFYFNDEGKLEKAQRAKQNKLNVNTKGKNYTVHPSFTDESSIDYVNGGWDKELTGIWIAKFEAGYASGNNNAPVVASEEFYENYNGNKVVVAGVERPRNEDGTTKSDGWEIARNWVDGMYGNSGSINTAIKYPTFQPLTYSMNYISSSEAYRISKALIGDNNIYGFDEENVDSHLMKNSEWGAVAYLSQSVYGKNSEITVNNATLNSGGNPRTSEEGKVGVDSVYAVTGCTSNSTSAGSKTTTIENLNSVSGNTATTEGLYVWNQVNGQNTSSSGNIYGIYDLSGGLWERTANFVSNGNNNINNYGKSLKEETGAITGTNGANTGTSTKYVTIYPSNDSGITDANTAYRVNYRNYANNTSIYGDAMREITDEKAGSDTGETGWTTSAGSIFGTTYKDYSHFPGNTYTLFLRGGRWNFGSSAGIFTFNNMAGNPSYGVGFRAVLVSKVGGSIEPVEILNFSEEETLLRGEKAKIALSYTGVIESTTYTSSNTNIATVDNKGNITASSNNTGTTNITATIKDYLGNVTTKTCAVAVNMGIARVDDKDYSTIQNAINSISTSGTILILNNTTENMVVQSGKTIQLDLNTKTLTVAAGAANRITINQGGALTISNGKITKNDNVQDSTVIANRGTLNITDGTYEHNLSSGTGIWMSVIWTAPTGTLNINGGTFTANDGGTIIANDGVMYINNNPILNGKNNAVFNDGTCTLNGGTLTASSEATINNANSGNLIINNGTMTGKTCGIYHCSSGTITMTSGTITAQTYDAIDVAGGGTLNVQGGTLNGKTSGIWLSHNSATVNVSGGNINGQTNDGIQVGGDATGGTVTITGGIIIGCNYGLAINANATINVNGGTITGTNNDGAHMNSSGAEIYLKAGTLQGKVYSISRVSGTIYYRATTLKKTSNNTTGTETIYGSWISW